MCSIISNCYAIQDFQKILCKVFEKFLKLFKMLKRISVGPKLKKIQTYGTTSVLCVLCVLCVHTIYFLKLNLILVGSILFGRIGKSKFPYSIEL